MRASGLCAVSGHVRPVEKNSPFHRVEEGKEGSGQRATMGNERADIGF